MSSLEFLCELPLAQMAKVCGPLLHDADTQVETANQLFSRIVNIEVDVEELPDGSYRANPDALSEVKSLLRMLCANSSPCPSITEGYVLRACSLCCCTRCVLSVCSFAVISSVCFTDNTTNCA